MNIFEPTKILIERVSELRCSNSFLILYPDYDVLSALRSDSNHVITNGNGNSTKDTGCNYHLEPTRANTWNNFPPVEWIIAKNPPIVETGLFLQHAYLHATRGLAIYTKLSILEPTIYRQEFLDQHPPDKMIVLPKINKDDSITSAWFVWLKGQPWNNNAITIIPKF